MFRNREQAALALAERLKDRPLHDPLVLGIPRGGVVLGAILARELGADLDVVLARKIRAPGMPELALGAIGETGQIYLDPQVRRWFPSLGTYLRDEIRFQKEEIARRRRLFRGDRDPLPVVGRSVIVTDDGVATGSTMIAALRTLTGRGPREVIVAVPVGSRERLELLRGLCDEVVSLLAPDNLGAVADYYDDFHQVEDEDVLSLLEDAHRRLTHPSKR
jgi:predicted phosphoribosyltransferase